MRPTLSLFRREFAAYFTNPTGYAALFGFLVLAGLLFNLALGLLTEEGPIGVEYPMQVLLGGADSPSWAQVAGVLFWGLFPAVTGMLTMRLLAEERGTGSIELLLTAPIRDWQVVAAKFIACFAFYVVLWFPTLVYVPVLADLGIAPGGIHLPMSTAVILGAILTALVYLTLLLRDAEPQTKFLLLWGFVGLCAVLNGVYLFVRTDTPTDRVLLAMLLQFATPMACPIVLFSLMRVVGIRVKIAAQITLVLGLLLATAVAVLFAWDAGWEIRLPFTADIDPAPVWTSYLGVLMAGAMFLALGLFVSSLVKSQLVAWMVSLLLGLAFVLPAFFRFWFEPGTVGYEVVYFVSVPEHFRQTFTRGQLDTRPLVLYATVTLLCLFLTVRSLEARRLR